jgi:hypothetical protein
LASGSNPEKLFSRPHHHQIRGQFTARRRAFMADSVPLFPNIIQPTAALKSYAPIGVKFWESQQAALDSIKDYSDGWFTRRQSGAQATLAAAKRISEAATPVDMHREYQDWLKGAMERMIAEGAAVQQQFSKAGSQLSAQLSSAAEAVKAVAEAQQSDARHSG